MLRNDPSSSRPDRLEIQFSIDGVKQEEMINEEIETINKIYEVISIVDIVEFNSFEYVYKINEKEGWANMGLVYKLNDTVVSQNYFDILNENLLESLSERLRSIMFNKTGGQWRKFVLSFQDNKIKTKFEYNEQYIGVCSTKYAVYNLTLLEALKIQVSSS